MACARQRLVERGPLVANSACWRRSGKRALQRALEVYGREPGRPILCVDTIRLGRLARRPNRWTSIDWCEFDPTLPEPVRRFIPTGSSGIEESVRTGNRRAK